MIVDAKATMFATEKRPMSKERFLHNIMTDNVFARVTGHRLNIDRDIRCGEHVLVLPGDLHVYIPAELNDDPEAMEQYMIGVVRHLIDNAKFCPCGHIYDSNSDSLIREYRREWEAVCWRCGSRNTPITPLKEVQSNAWVCKNSAACIARDAEQKRRAQPESS